MEELLHKYGYFAVLVGTILEGGTLLTMAGFLAHQGYMKIVPWVIAAGFAGNFIDTLICYTVGFRGGMAVIKKRPKWQPRLRELSDWLEKYQSLTIIGVRFVPGLRTLGGVAIGIARIPLGKFLILNAVGALLWATTIGLSGYLFGHLLQVIMGDLKKHELPIVAALAACGLIVWFVVRRIRRKPAPVGGTVAE